MARTSIAATVDGTASVIGGDKFANGATSGAFVHLFNAEGGTITKAFQSLTSGLVGVGDYLGRISGFRDWQVNSIGLGDNYYRNQAIDESDAVYALGVHIVENPRLSAQALSIYYNLNSTQMDANTMVNFYVGLAVPGVGALSLAGNTMSEAHEINGIYNNLRNSR